MELLGKGSSSPGVLTRKDANPKLTSTVSAATCAGPNPTRRKAPDARLSCRHWSSWSRHSRRSRPSVWVTTFPLFPEPAWVKFLTPAVERAPDRVCRNESSLPPIRDQAGCEDPSAVSPGNRAEDHDVGDPRGEARAQAGTHCRKVSRRLVPEAGTPCRGRPAGSPRCTASGRRLPWPWEAGWAGHAGKVCMEGG